MYADRAVLDFAYHYPFSKEARDVIAQAGQALDDRLIRAGRDRVEQDLNSDSIAHSSISMPEIKQTYVLSYVYSRMMISAIGNKVHLERYVMAEARRARNSLEEDTLPNLLKLLSELELEMSYSGERFIIGFAKFLMLSSRSEELSLAKQELDKGLVYLSRESALKLMENAIADEIRKKLPIPPSELPRRIIEESKSVKLPKINTRVEIREGSYRWIEQILSNPLPDIRHRTVNLILAPYLVNIKGMSEEDAVNIITEFIEKCRQINPGHEDQFVLHKVSVQVCKNEGIEAPVTGKGQGALSWSA